MAANSIPPTMGEYECESCRLRYPARTYLSACPSCGGALRRANMPSR